MDWIEKAILSQYTLVQQCHSVRERDTVVGSSVYRQRSFSSTPVPPTPSVSEQSMPANVVPQHSTPPTSGWGPAHYFTGRKQVKEEVG